MPGRHVFISSSVKLSVRLNQLVIRSLEAESSDEYTLPLEDIQTIMIESQRSLVTTSCLSKIADSGIVMYTCDAHHFPNGILTSFLSHFETTSVMSLQMSISKPLTKRLWQAVAKQKIRNQACCAETVGQIKTAKQLMGLEASVRSGDETGVEAQAARVYFKGVFGDSFVRSSENVINGALNYGYAIIRGQVARSLVATGFLPSFGIHHHNTLNALNLVDDMMEPYRPVVDLLVLNHIVNESGEDGVLTSSMKKILFGVLTQKVRLGDLVYDVSSSTSTVSESLKRAMERSNAGDLVLPVLSGE